MQHAAQSPIAVRSWNRHRPGATRSPWVQDAPCTASESESLAPDQSADACVIGAGIAGLSVAYMLAREGLSVIVLDDGPVGGGETSRSSAHLTSVIDGGFAHIETLHGPEGARLAHESHAAAIERIGAIVREEGIDCDFQRVDGFLFAAPGAASGSLARECEAAKRAGAEVQAFEHSPLAGLLPGACLRFSNQAQMDPLRYLAGVRKALAGRGVRIHCGMHVLTVEDGDPTRVELEGGGAVTARVVVVATHSPFTTLVAMHTKQAAYRTFALAAECPRGTVPSVLMWDTADPYHYVRVIPARSGDESDLLLVGGEDHKTGQADDSKERFARIEAWVRANFPSAGKVRYRWSGQVQETLDHLAYIGLQPHAKHVYLVTGDSGMGLTHATIAGILLNDLVAGRSNPWRDLYAPDRRPLLAAGDYVRENLNVVAQYADLLRPGDVASIDEIPRGAGAVVRRGAQLVAVYRDATGELQERSALCTHLGGVLHWNSIERSWDCPCHGSRFDTSGRVLNGPASKALQEVEQHPSEPTAETRVRVESR